MNIHNMFRRFVRVMIAMALVLAAALIQYGGYQFFEWIYTWQ